MAKAPEAVSPTARRTKAEQELGNLQSQLSQLDQQLREHDAQLAALDARVASAREHVIRMDAQYREATLAVARAKTAAWLQPGADTESAHTESERQAMLVDTARQKARDELATTIQNVNAERAKVEAARAGVEQQRAGLQQLLDAMDEHRSQAHREAGEDELRTAQSEHSQLVAALEKAQSSHQAAQANLEQFHKSVTERMAPWPEHQSAVAEMLPHPLSDVRALIGAFLAYCDALENHANLQMPWSIGGVSLPWALSALDERSIQLALQGKREFAPLVRQKRQHAELVLQKLEAEWERTHTDDAHRASMVRHANEHAQPNEAQAAVYRKYRDKLGTMTQQEIDALVIQEAVRLAQRRAQ
jgi:hypothetical protein